jgi:hypothetical protein
MANEYSILVTRMTLEESAASDMPRGWLYWGLDAGGSELEMATIDTS